jgi:DNA mismatch repair protein MutL
LRERIFQLYGKEILDRLMEIDYGEGGGRLFGFASRPPQGRADRSHQFFFVNNRPVRDKILASALNQAYRGLLEKEMSPEAFLFLTVPYGEVDVNVHPAKSEVRFRDSSSVFRLVLRSIERARYGIGGLKEIEAGGAVAGGADAQGGAGAPPVFAPFEFSPAARIDLGFPFKIGERPGSFGRPSAGPDSEPAGGIAGEGSELRVLGQFADAYIVVESGDGLLVVDQHNAHERILFDKYAEIRTRKTWPVAMSLVPLLFDLSPSQVVRLEAEQVGLEESGFRVEPMGGRSYALREYPDIFKPQEALSVVTSLLEEDPDGPGEERKKERLLATMACKSAIKAGQPLPKEKMEFLVRELFRTTQPSLCPHGRPIVVKIPRGQIEKGLGRRA